MAEAATARGLDGVEMLKPLSAEARAEVARRCAWRTYQPDETVIDQTDAARDVCFVVEGRVRIVNHSLSGREISFDDIDAGGFLGELSALDGGARSASVVARKPDTVIAFLAPKAFQELVSSHPELALAVMRRLCAVVRRSNERIMDLSTLAANNRVQAELLRLATPLRRPDGSATLAPVPVHADIAGRVSTTRETVARVLSDLTRDGLVRKHGAALLIDDLDALQELVENVRGRV
jgi:CRP/FNR family transcriptional regulator, cyclic AMP receptor protein